MNADKKRRRFIQATLIAPVAADVVVAGGSQALGNQKRSRSPFTGQLMKLGPAAIKNMRIGYRIAEITGDGQMQLHVLRESIREKITAIVIALSRLKLINVPAQKTGIVIDALSQYAYKASGVPSHV